jgi:hypothetical protein
MLAPAARVELPVDTVVGVRSVALVDADGEVITLPRRGEPLEVEVEVEAAERVAGLDLAVIILTSDGTRLLDESFSDQENMPELAPGPGRWRVRLRIPPLLRAADYVVTIWLGTETDTFLYRDLLAFQVTPSAADRQDWQVRRRLAQPPVSWSSQRIEGDG